MSPGQRRPVIVYAHGFNGFKDWGNFDLIARAFTAAGFAFLKFNFSHNGTSPDHPEDFFNLEAFGQNNYTKQLDDLGSVLDWVSDEKTPLADALDADRIGLIGHSMGGGIAIIKTSEDKRIKADKAFCQQDSVTQPATVYGISKAAGDNWCQYYHNNYGVDVRSIRYPGLISHRAPPGGGTTDYAVDIFHHAARGEAYTCFLRGDTVLPMMYMPDAVAGTLQLMEAPAGPLSVRTAYHVGGFNFSPDQLAAAIRRYLPTFVMYCLIN